MLRFTEIDKAIINKIAGFNTESPRIFGFELCDALFNTDKVGIFLSRIHYENRYICHLLALNDGGKSHNQARNAIVELISLMDFLEENRFILIADGPKIADSVLLFNESYYQMVLSFSDSTCVGSTPNSNVYRIDIEQNAILTLTERIKDGYRDSIIAMITLSSGDCLSSILYGQNLRNRLVRILTSQIYPTLKLQEFINRDFRTESQYFSEETLDRADKQVKKGTQAVTIALISVMLSIIFQLFATNTSTIKLVLLLLLLSIFFIFGYFMNENESNSN